MLGFGMGNLKDTKMEQMADKGNGHYAYIDTFREAQKVFVQEFGGTLFTIAKDVKIQVEFNPARVQAYRLLGYENRLLAKEDFADDRKDAGELGAGHTVTALYEIVPVGAKAVALVDDSLVYQHVALRPGASRTSDMLTVRLRYKEPAGSTSKLITSAVADRNSAASSDDMRFASAVAAFAMLLRDSENKGSVTFDQVITMARDARGADPEGYRGEFIGMVEAARTLRGVSGSGTNRVAIRLRVASSIAAEGPGRRRPQVLHEIDHVETRFTDITSNHSQSEVSFSTGLACSRERRARPVRGPVPPAPRSFRCPRPPPCGEDAIARRPNPG